MVKKKVVKRSRVPKPSSRKSSTKKYKKKSNMWIVFAFLGLAVLFSFLFNLSQVNLTGNVITGYQVSGGTTGSEVGTWFELLGSDPLAKLFTYIFGVPILLAGLTGSIVTSSAVVTLAIWLLMFFTFGDIISTFSSFGMGKKRKWIAWVIALMITIVAANIGAIVKIAAIFTGIFAGIAVVGVYIGLGAALLAFIAVNLGIKGLSGWLMRRKAMMYAASAQAGGVRLAGGVKGFSNVAKELEKFGNP